MTVDQYLEEGRIEIDKYLEQYFPHKTGEKYLNALLGEPMYKYDTETFQKAVTDPLWDLLDRGGKRWRPWMYLTLIKCLDGDVEKYGKMCAVLELIHNGSLVADDIEDDSKVRRNKPAIHIIYGVDVAVNLSSLMYFLPTKMLDDLDTDADTYRRLSAVLHEELIRIHVGQATDIGWHKALKAPDRITVDEYLQMCANKTGVLPRLACKWAGIVSGLEDDDVDKAGAFGESIGVAFQIQDDMMNLKMAEGLGKEAAEDITEGKKTLMVIHVFQKADEADKKRLSEILQKHTDKVEDKKEAIAIMEKYDAFNYAAKTAKDIVLNAWADAEKALPDNEYKNMLHELAIYCVERKR